MSLTILSSITLLSSPSWFFPGFNVLHSVSNGNLGLWSFMVINASDLVYLQQHFVIIINILVTTTQNIRKKWCIYKYTLTYKEVF